MPYTPPDPNDDDDDDDDDTTTTNGLLSKWWKLWIKDYYVILLGTEEKPVLKVLAWQLLCYAAAVPTVLAFALGAWIG